MTAAASARVDQMLTAIREARVFAPYNGTLLDPDAGDPYTSICAKAVAIGLPEGPTGERGAEGAVVVRGDFAETYAEGYGGGDEDWPTPLDAVGLATFLGEQECRRCALPGKEPVLVWHVLRIAVGRTVVEMAYCDACAKELDLAYSGLRWTFGGPYASV